MRMFSILLFLSISILHASSFDCDLLNLDKNSQSAFLLQTENLKIWIEEQNIITQQLFDRYQKGERATSIRKVDGGMNGQDIEFFTGFPQRVELKIAGTEIYRRFSPNNFTVIKEEKILRAGSRPLILPQSHLRKEFVDLTGIFMTTPDVDPANLLMGYHYYTPYVDFQLPVGLKILFFGDGNYLVPGAPSVVSWMAKAYADSQISKIINPLYQFNFDLIDRRGGLKLPLLVPIILVD